MQARAETAVKHGVELVDSGGDVRPGLRCFQQLVSYLAHVCRAQGAKQAYASLPFYLMRKVCRLEFGLGELG